MMDEDKIASYQASLCDFMSLNQGDTFNVILGIVIFVVYGVVRTLDPHGDGYSYRNDCCTDVADSGDACICFDPKPHCKAFNRDGDNGRNDFSMGYCAGAHGPGAFPVATILVIVAVVVYFTKMAKYFCCPDRIEKKRRYDQIIMSERQSSYQSQMGGSGGDK